MTPPPSEPTTGQTKRQQCDWAMQAITLAKSPMQETPVILDRLYDSALASQEARHRTEIKSHEIVSGELKAERTTLQAALAEVQREWPKIVAAVTDKLLAAEQREREAGEREEALWRLLMAAHPDHPRPELCATCEVIDSDTLPALAAIRSGPAPAAIDVHPLDALAGATGEWPAQVSDPPTACVRGSDGCQIKGRHSMCGTVVAEPTAKGETRRHRTWCNSRRVGGIGRTCPCVPVADPTETER